MVVSHDLAGLSRSSSKTMLTRATVLQELRQMHVEELYADNNGEGLMLLLTLPLQDLPHSIFDLALLRDQSECLYIRYPTPIFMYK